MWIRRASYLVLILLAVTGTWVAWSMISALPAPPGDKKQQQKETTRLTLKPDICEETVFEGARAILCVVDPKTQGIALAYRGPGGQPYGSVANFVAASTDNGRVPVLAMNSGMYHADMEPVGLYVENGKELSPLNTGDDFGNFFLKPNGVFFLRADGHAGIMETTAYAEAGIAPAFATQSGPMLVIDGAIHPRFRPDGTTKYIRNGVGVGADGTVVLAITRDPVSLGSFARLFRDVANCPNALFFDGAVSSLAWGTQMEIDAGEPAGPIVAVFGKADD
ncbi:MAG: phosphodiester glycosidase family protein [Hoeflea sp.]|uniref:phosphodiester glycosidase family protein n=1 Tax=Hoeflea sp. TaxID=1940281 RepID=UPI003EF779CF